MTPRGTSWNQPKEKKQIWNKPIFEIRSKLWFKFLSIHSSIAIKFNNCEQILIHFANARQKRQSFNKSAPNLSPVDLHWWQCRYCHKPMELQIWQNLTNLTTFDRCRYTLTEIDIFDKIESKLALFSGCAVCARRVRCAQFSTTFDKIWQFLIKFDKSIWQLLTNLDQIR